MLLSLTGDFNATEQVKYVTLHFEKPLNVWWRDSCLIRVISCVLNEAATAQCYSLTCDMLQESCTGKPLLARMVNGALYSTFSRLEVGVYGTIAIDLVVDNADYSDVLTRASILVEIADQKCGCSPDE